MFLGLPVSPHSSASSTTVRCQSGTSARGGHRTLKGAHLLNLYFFSDWDRPIPIGAGVRGFVRGWLVPRIMSSYGSVVHVAHGTDGVVINPTPSGDQVWAESEFCQKVRGFAGSIPVLTPRIPVLEPSASPITISRAIMRRLSLGYVRGNDCVWRASEVLRAAGVYVPRAVLTPQGLLEFALDRQARS